MVGVLRRRRRRRRRCSPSSSVPSPCCCYRRRRFVRVKYNTLVHKLKCTTKMGRMYHLFFYVEWESSNAVGYSITNTATIVDAIHCFFLRPNKVTASWCVKHTHTHFTINATFHHSVKFIIEQIMADWVNELRWR